MATLAHNLDVRRAACKSCYNCEVGWIGDSAHMHEESDHNPDSRGIVHAIDVMLPLGAHADAVVKWALAHPDDLEYVIHNRIIYKRVNGFKGVAYTGSDPHTSHVHLSGKHGSTGENSHTGTGYSTTAEAMSPAGKPCAPAVVHAPGSRELKVMSPNLRGADVSYVQSKVDVSRDSIYGPGTATAVKVFQGHHGLGKDGIVGPKTWLALGIKGGK